MLEKKFPDKVGSQWNRFLPRFKRHLKVVLGDVGYWVRAYRDSAGLVVGQDDPERLFQP